MGIDLPDRPRLRLREAVKFWQEGTPAVANAVPQRHQSHVNARDVTYFLPPPAIEFKEDTELDPNIIAMRKVVAAEKGRDLEFDVVRPDPAAVDAMYEFDCKLSEAAFAGKVKIFGRRDDQVSADEPIPVGYFVNPRGFCRDDGQIDPHPYPIDDAAMFRQAISHDRPIWHEVQVERAGYVAWLTVEYPSVAATLCDTAGGTTSRKTAATGKRLVTRAPPPPTRLTGGCTPPQTSKETSNPPEYRPSLSEMIEFNRARGECRGIIEMGRDLAGVNQIKWDYEAKRWADVVRPRLDQVITDRRKSGAPNEHLAMLARELAEFDAEFKLVG